MSYEYLCRTSLAFGSEFLLSFRFAFSSIGFSRFGYRYPGRFILAGCVSGACAGQDWMDGHCPLFQVQIQSFSRETFHMIQAVVQNKRGALLILSVFSKFCM